MPCKLDHNGETLHVVKLLAYSQCQTAQKDRAQAQQLLQDSFSPTSYFLCPGWDTTYGVQCNLPVSIPMVF